MRRDHPREAAEDRSGPSIEEIEAEHRKRKVRSRDRDQAVQVNSAQKMPAQWDRERGREEKKTGRTAASNWFAPTVSSGTSPALAQPWATRHSMKSILTRWVTAIMKGEKRNGVSSGVLRPCSAEPKDQLTGVLFLPGYSMQSSQ